MDMRTAAVSSVILSLGRKCLGPRFHNGAPVPSISEAVATMMESTNE